VWENNPSVERHRDGIGLKPVFSSIEPPLTAGLFPGFTVLMFSTLRNTMETLTTARRV
jgi:hypothetical protein